MKQQKKIKTDMPVCVAVSMVLHLLHLRWGGKMNSTVRLTNFAGKF